MDELTGRTRRLELFPLLCGLVLVAIGVLVLLAAGGVRIDLGWVGAGVLLLLGALGLALSLRGGRRPPDALA